MPNGNEVVYNSESKSRIEIRINSDGFRDDDYSHEKPANTERIVILGDSFGAAFEVRIENTFHGLLEARLNERDAGKMFEVINLGVHGYGTAQEYLALKRYGFDYGPDLVILCFFVGNDVKDNSNKLTGKLRVFFEIDQNGELSQVPFDGARFKASSFLGEHSEFYEWQKRKVRKLTKILEKKVMVAPRYQIFYADYSDGWAEAWQITKRLILRIRDETELQGARFMLVSIPDADQVYDDLWQETLHLNEQMESVNWDLEKPSRIIREFARDNDIDLLDLSIAFKEYVGDAGERLYLEHGHFSVRGHRVVSELLYDKILRDYDKKESKINF